MNPEVDKSNENGIPSAVAPAWKQWCRLCGKDDPQGNINVFFKDEQMTANLTFSGSIGKYFCINITEDDEFPKMLCTECFSVVTSLVNFSERINKVQEMFSALHSASPALDINFHEVRLKYGLEDHVSDHMLLNSSMEIHCSESKISVNNAFHKEKMENTTHPIKTEAIWIDDFNGDDNNGTCSNEEEGIKKSRDSLIEEESSVRANYSGSNTKGNNDNIAAKEESEVSSEPPKKRLRQRRKNSNYNDDESIADENSNVDNAHGKINETDNQSYNCSDCGRKYRRLNHFHQHMKRTHNTNVDSPQIPCSECKKSFPTKRKLQLHEKVHLPLAVKQHVPCPFCDKKFTTTHSMRSHISIIHLGERLFICEECGVAVRSNTVLKMHMLTHTEERPIECKVCKKGFKNKIQLRVHTQTHDLHKHICATCGLQLNSKATLNRHLLVHSDQKKHKCDYCGREFKRAKALKNHLILHTGLKPYLCNFCDKTFATGSNCRSHKKKAHPEELAELEASGEIQTFTKNIPKLELLKAVTKAADNLAPVVTKQSGNFAFRKKRSTEPSATTVALAEAAVEDCSSIPFNQHEISKSTDSQDSSQLLTKNCLPFEKNRDDVSNRTLPSYEKLREETSISEEHLQNSNPTHSEPEAESSVPAMDSLWHFANTINS